MASRFQSAVQHGGYYGTINSPVTNVRELVNGNDHTTTMTVSGSFAAIAGAGAYNRTMLLYLFPGRAGFVVHIQSAYMSIGITQTSGNINADTPDVGLGMLGGNGSSALLSTAGATHENILTGQTATDCTGTPTTASASQAVTGAAGVYLNIADSWAGADAGPVAAGTVIVCWKLVKLES